MITLFLGDLQVKIKIDLKQSKSMLVNETFFGFVYNLGSF